MVAINKNCLLELDLLNMLQDTLEIDEDLLENSTKSLETLVAVGMKLGVSTKKQAGPELPNLENCAIGA